MKRDFQGTGLTLNRWEGTDGKRIPDNRVEDITTGTCNLLCSSNTIGKWLSHYKLWEHIVKNEEDRALILEDNVYPVQDFKNKVVKFWDNIPVEWDIIFLGCCGTCIVDSLDETFYRIGYGRENSKIDKYIIKPGYPKGFYAYVISYDGAKKLLEHPEFKKINDNIDINFAKNIIDDSSFNIFAFVPQLIYKYDTKENFQPHRLMNPFDNTKILHYRPLGIDFTLFTIFLLASSFLVGLYGNKRLKNNFLILSISILVFEVAYTETNSKKIKTILVELLLLFASFKIGERSRGYIYR